MPRPKRNKIPMTRTQAQRFTALELEVMKRLVEREPEAQIAHNLGIDQASWIALVGRPEFSDEVEYHRQNQDRHIRARLDGLATEALDVVREIMRTASSPANRLRAALEILDRSGNVKVEKRITLTADAESVIKHLNQLGEKPTSDQELIEAEVVEEDSFEKAAREVSEQGI
jgi:hypothetical protein